MVLTRHKQKNHSKDPAKSSPRSALSRFWEKRDFGLDCVTGAPEQRITTFTEHLKGRKGTARNLVAKSIACPHQPTIAIGYQTLSSAHVTIKLNLAGIGAVLMLRKTAPPLL